MAEKNKTAVNDTEGSNIEARVSALETSVKALADDNAALKKENASLKKSLEAKANTGVQKPAEKPKLPTEAFKVDGKEYEFVHPKFIFEKVEYTAVDALTDKELLAKLVAKGAGCIRKKA